MIVFSIGSLHVYWYGLFYATAFLLGYGFFWWLRKKEIFKTLQPEFHVLLVSHLEDIFVYAMLGVLLGGRLGHVVIYNFGYYLQHPLEIFAVWEGGMSFIGGIVGVVVAMLLFIKRTKLSWKGFLVMMDCLLIPVVFGIMLGRIGNFLNQELYGIIVPSGSRGWGYGIVSVLRDLHIFHVYPLIDQSLRVNTNFLASFGEGFCLLVVFLGIFLSSLKKKTRSIGLISSLFLVLYSGVRFFLEYIRADSQMEYIGGLTISQWYFVVFFVIGVSFWIATSLRSSQGHRSYPMK